MIRTNLLIYQKFTVGLFLNLAKGYRQEDKALLKVSFVLSLLSLLIIYGNAYILYYIVEREYKKNKKVLMQLKDKENTLALRQSENSNKKKNKVQQEHLTADQDDSIMELKPDNSGNNFGEDRNIKILKKKKKTKLK